MNEGEVAAHNMQLSGFTPGHKIKPTGSSTLIPEDTKDLNGVKIVNIYASSCPACQASTEVLRNLERRGAKVLHLQTDTKRTPPLYKTSRPYTMEFAGHFPYEVTPTLYVKTAGKEPEMIEGGRSFTDLYSHLIDLNGGRKSGS